MVQVMLLANNTDLLIVVFLLDHMVLDQQFQSLLLTLKGRITSATTTAVGSALTVTGDSGSEDINLLSEGLAITGGTNVTYCCRK